MVPDNPRATLTAVAVGMLVLLSSIGAGGAAVTQQPPAVDRPAHDVQLTPSGVNDSNDSTATDGDEVVEQLEDRLASLDTAVVTYETTMRSDDRTTTSERRLWIDRENNRVRTEVETNRTNRITVRNESAIVTYDVENNRVSRVDRSGEATPQTLIETLVNSSELTYEGRDRIDGEPTYRLDVEPTDGAGSGSFDMTLWLDPETYFPTRITTVSGSGDSEFTSTIRVRNVTLNEPIPDDRFTIDTPEDADRRDHSTPDRTTYDSLSTLQAETDGPGPDPDLPDAYTFEEGVVTAGADYDSISLRYAAGDQYLNVVKRPASGYDLSESDTFREVDVGNDTGYYTEYEFDGVTTAVVILPCGDVTYSVSGPLSKGESLGVAESLGCE
jgi:outer membrane lipoprotein-sorting protein